MGSQSRHIHGRFAPLLPPSSSSSPLPTPAPFPTPSLSWPDRRMILSQLALRPLL